jgi:predicted ester cyclase
MSGAGEGERWLEGTRGPWRDLPDYILGITHEIWESRQVAKIHDYYSRDCLLYTLGGLIRGADTVVRNTRETLEAFPDRLLLGDAVVWSREGPGRFYSSHRISSPMTHLGPGSLGPPTGRRVQVTTIADCLVEDGLITTEWLVRDNYGLVRQLGLDPLALARRTVSQPPDPEHARWLAAELERVRAAGSVPAGATGWAASEAVEFARDVLLNAWTGRSAAAFERHYQPYAVRHHSRPVNSGRAQVAAAAERAATTFGDVALTVDHVCLRPDDDSHQVAARWCLAARHVGDAWGVPPTGRDFLILGVTHWKLVAGRIAAEWTIFDRMAVLAQLLREPG